MSQRREDPGEFSKYLEAKRSLDDRSLNPRVWSAFRAALPCQTEVLDIGCGLGVTLERLLDPEFNSPQSPPFACDMLRYTGLDSDPKLISLASERLPARLGLAPRNRTITDDGVRLELSTPSGALEIMLRALDLLRFASAHEGSGRWNAIVAHAVLDLVDLNAALIAVARLAAPRALFYASLCFDDLTVIEPMIDADLDERILLIYHRHMYASQWGGGDGHTRSGRRLLGALPGHGMEILDAGPSDWVIVPRNGDYPENERLILRFLLTHIQRVVTASGEIPTPAVAEWTQARLQQVNRGELIYLAHQLDVLARVQPQA